MMTFGSSDSALARKNSKMCMENCWNTPQSYTIPNVIFCTRISYTFFFVFPLNIALPREANILKALSCRFETFNMWQLYRIHFAPRDTLDSTTAVVARTLDICVCMCMKNAWNGAKKRMWSASADDSHNKQRDHKKATPFQFNGNKK